MKEAWKLSPAEKEAGCAGAAWLRAAGRVARAAGLGKEWWVRL